MTEVLNWPCMTKISEMGRGAVFFGFCDYRSTCSGLHDNKACG